MIIIILHQFHRHFLHHHFIPIKAILLNNSILAKHLPLTNSSPHHPPLLSHLIYRFKILLILQHLFIHTPIKIHPIFPHPHLRCEIIIIINTMVPILINVLLLYSFLLYFCLLINCDFFLIVYGIVILVVFLLRKTDLAVTLFSSLFAQRKTANKAICESVGFFFMYDYLTMLFYLQ